MNDEEILEQFSRLVETAADLFGHDVTGLICEYVAPGLKGWNDIETEKVIGAMHRVERSGGMSMVETCERLKKGEKVMIGVCLYRAKRTLTNAPI